MRPVPHETQSSTYGVTRTRPVVCPPVSLPNDNYLPDAVGADAIRASAPFLRFGEDMEIDLERMTPYARDLVKLGLKEQAAHDAKLR